MFNEQKNNEETSAKIVIHESGVAMGKEAYDTGKQPEGVVAKTGLPEPAPKSSDIAGFENTEEPAVSVETVSA